MNGKNRLTALWIGCVIVVVGVFGRIMFKHFYSAPELVLSNGVTVPGKSAGEIGTFGEPGYEYVQVRDMEAKKIYKTFTMSPLDVSDADRAEYERTFDALIQSELKHNSSIANQVTTDMVRALRSEVFLVLASDSGMSEQEYRNSRPTGAVPLNPRSVTIPGDKSPDVYFSEMYQKKLKSGVRLQAACFDPTHVALAFGQHHLPDNTRPGLKEKGEKGQFPEFFLGMNVAVSPGYVFYRDPNYDNLNKNGVTIISFSCSLIVESNVPVTGPDGKEMLDRYPLNMTFIYDPENMTWWPESIDRTVGAVASGQMPTIN